jgi:hypothetical protein
MSGHLTRMVCKIVLLAVLVLIAVSPGASTFASTNSGIDTPTGVTSLPLAVEGVEGMVLYNSSPPNGPVNVGIGTTAPNPVGAAAYGRVLDIVNSTSGARATLELWDDLTPSASVVSGQINFLSGTSPSAVAAAILSTPPETTANTGNLEFWTSNTSSGISAANMVISAAGNVGVGATNPIGNLDIENGTDTATLCLNGQCTQTLSEAPPTVVSTGLVQGVATAVTSVSCPAGKYARGGGAACTGSSICQAWLAQSYPTGNPSTGWAAECFCFGGGGAGDYVDYAVSGTVYVNAYAICQ